MKSTAGKSLTAGAGRNWTPRGGKARRVGEFVPRLMQPVFEKFGFPAAAILTDWAAIAGPELASFTAPERLKWPKRASRDNSGEDGKAATLVLRVGGARALEVDHMRPRIIERINASFGYRAVGDIRIVQAPLPERSAAKSHSGAGPLSCKPSPANLQESRLDSALARISEGVQARNAETGDSPPEPQLHGKFIAKGV